MTIGQPRREALLAALVVGAMLTAVLLLAVRAGVIR